MAITKTTLIVHGMSCASCEAKVRTAVSALEGVTEVTVVVQTGRVTILHDPALSPADIADLITSLGYQVEETELSSASRG